MSNLDTYNPIRILFAIRVFHSQRAILDMCGFHCLAILLNWLQIIERKIQTEQRFENIAVI